MPETITAIDHAVLQGQLRGTRDNHNPTFDAHWTDKRDGTVVYLSDGSLLLLDWQNQLCHIKGNDSEQLQVSVTSTEEAFRLIRSFGKQYEVKVQAQRLLKVLEEDVPAGVAHYAVEDAKRALATFVRQAHTIDYFYGR